MRTKSQLHSGTRPFSHEFEQKPAEPSESPSKPSESERVLCPSGGSDRATGANLKPSSGQFEHSKAPVCVYGEDQVQKVELGENLIEKDPNVPEGRFIDYVIPVEKPTLMIRCNDCLVGWASWQHDKEQLLEFCNEHYGHDLVVIQIRKYKKE